MTWLDSYQQGSFRGAKFLTRSHEAEGGRRAALHEYPDRDLPWSEDLGRRARRWSIECMVIGDDYLAARDGLITALEGKGPGQLVHPWLGQLNAQVRDFRFSESTEQGGMASFSVQFQEAGQKSAGQASLDSAAASRGAADTVQDDAAGRFASGFSVEGLPAWAEAGSVGQLLAFATSARSAGEVLGAAGPLLRAYEDGLRALDGAVALVRSPLNLAGNVVAMVRAVGALGTAPLARLRSLIGMFSQGRLPPAVIGLTPVRVRERANGAAMAGLIAAATVAEAVRTMSQVRFRSYQEAAGLREELAEALDAAMIDAADRQDDMLAAALGDLRVAMVRDVTARAATLARLTLYTPVRSEPALSVAWRLYGGKVAGAALFEELLDAAVQRNRVRHPMLVPGGIAVEVLAGDLGRAGLTGGLAHG